MSDHRKYIRHPVEIPIEYKLVGESAQRSDVTVNVSYGGLCFRAKTAIPTGTKITLIFPSINLDLEISGIVMWCAEKEGYVDIGIEFEEESEAYRARTIEEICYIRKFEKNHPQKNY